MAHRLQKPVNPYDPAWIEYARQNPGLRRSLSAADGEDGFDFVPDEFKGEDGAVDTAAFRTAYDESVSFKAQADEAAAALPQDAAGYEFGVPEDHVLPEGFDPEVLRQPVLDDAGKPVMGEDGKPQMKDFDVNDMIDAEDPDLPLLQSALHEAGAKPELMGKLASILANRELRSVLKMTEEATAEKTALGPNGQSRIDTVKRSIASRVPEGQAKAIMDSITSADGLKGMEALLKSSKAPPSPAPGQKAIDNATATIDERLEAGLAARKRA